MTCRQAEKLMMKYMDGEISEKEATDLNSHIKGCADCREHFFTYDSIIKEAEQIETVKTPEGFEAAVMETVKTLPQPSYQYTVADKLKMIRVLLITVLVGLSYYVSANKELIYSKLLQYPAFSDYLNKIAPFGRYAETVTKDIGAIFMQVMTQVDNVLYSLGGVMVILIVVFCIAQAVIIFRHNKKMK